MAVGSGGKPVRSKLTRRISVLLEAAGALVRFFSFCLSVCAETILAVEISNKLRKDLSRIAFIQTKLGTSDKTKLLIFVKKIR